MNKAHNAELRLFLEVELGPVTALFLFAFISCPVFMFKLFIIIIMNLFIYMNCSVGS